jgi:hypothetical protein
MEAIAEFVTGRVTRGALAAAIGMVAFAVAGCTDYSSQNDALRAQLIEKDKLTASLQKNVNSLTDENAQCQRQVVTLQALTPEQRQEGIPTVMEVSIVKRSGIYDTATPGREPRLIIYFRPLDDAGDAIKAPGAVHIELWDLDARPEQAMLAKWDIPAAELKKDWSGSLLADFYRVSFTVPEDYGQRKNLTVKLTFTDYFTGHTFSGQLPITSK